MFFHRHKDSSRFLYAFLALIVCLAAAQDGPSSWLDVNPDVYKPPASDVPAYSTTSEPVTSTVQNRPVITTVEVPYSVSTATADAGNVKAGDLVVELSKSFKDHLVDLAKTSCGIKKRNDVIVPRAASCDMGAFMQGAVGDGAPGGLDIISFRKPIITANDMERGVRKFFATGRALYRSRLFLGGVALVALGIFIDHDSHNIDAPIRIPKEDLGEPTGNTVAPIADDSAGTDSKGSSCKATKTGKTAPICDDKPYCDGLASKTCVVDNEDKNCPCVTAVYPKTHPADAELLTAQMAILQTIAWSDEPSPTPTPDTCRYDSEAHPVNGAAKSPSEWCYCGVGSTYAVASTGTPCPPDITKNPTITIGVSSITSSATPTPSVVCVNNAANGWSISVEDAKQATSDYCDKLVKDQDGGTEVTDKWPGSCAWVFDGDVKKMAVGFTANNKCDGETPIINPDQCKASFLRTINECNDSPPNAKWGGTVVFNCMSWTWHAAPYSMLGYPCVGQYAGPDKAPITKRRRMLEVEAKPTRMR